MCDGIDQCKSTRCTTCWETGPTWSLKMQFSYWMPSTQTKKCASMLSREYRCCLMMSFVSTCSSSLRLFSTRRTIFRHLAKCLSWGAFATPMLSARPSSGVSKETSTWRRHTNDTTSCLSSSWWHAADSSMSFSYRTWSTRAFSQFPRSSLQKKKKPRPSKSRRKKLKSLLRIRMLRLRIEQKSRLSRMKT